MRQSFNPEQRPCFVALETQIQNPEALQCLGSRLMHWGDWVWLIDVTPFASYWTGEAVQRRMSVGQLWRGLLEKVHGPQFRASVAEHPWQAVLLMLHLKSRGIEGLTHIHGKLGTHVYKSLPWDVWWEAVEQLAGHWSQDSGFKLPACRQACERMKRMIQRLLLKTPLEAAYLLHTQGIQRRFGAHLAAVWSWGFQGNGLGEPGEQGPCPAPKKLAFPWKPCVFEAPLCVQRHDDDGLMNWENLEPYLREDLNQLAHLLPQNQRVLNIQWQMTLSDLSTVDLPMCFRYPHDLHAEQPDQKTALAQAKYAFEARLFPSRTRKRKVPKFVRSQDTDEILSVIRWNLSLPERWKPPVIPRDLFGHTPTAWNLLERLRELENLLPIPLFRYQPRVDWLPEKGFGPLDESDEEEGGVERPPSPSSQNLWNLSLQAVGKQRPLYLLAQPHPIPTPALTRLAFLENTLTAWWMEPGTEGERRYYQWVDDERRRCWVFQNAKGEWFLHGFFH